MTSRWAEVLSASADRVAETGRRAVTFRVFPTDYRASTIVSPQSPTKVDTPVRVSYIGEVKFLATIDRSGGDPYTVTALVPKRSDDKDGALTINQLRAAGTTYPPEISTQYLEVPDGAIPEGGDAEALLDAILAEVEDPDNPYDVASTMVDYLQSSANFKYDADIRDLACEGLSVVECFARFRQGYCQYYASTMAILLREHGIPTRLAAGFLPGDRDGGSSSACRSAPPMPGSRSTSPATAGWSSTRRAVAWLLRCHCRPANWLHRRASAVQKTAAIPSGGATPVAMRRRSSSWPCRGRPTSVAAAGRAAARARQD